MHRLIFSIDTKIPNELVNLIHSSIENTNSPWRDAMVQDPSDGQYKIIESYRNSHHKWVETDRWECAYVWYYLDRLNKQYFGYQLDTYDSGELQYTKYDVGQHYDWHVDESRGLIDPVSGEKNKNIRKLSFTLQLSEPSDYDGGDLIFQDFATGQQTTASREKGSLIVFDSRVRHKISPVTRGTRHALVGWLVGNSWT